MSDAEIIHGGFPAPLAEPPGDDASAEFDLHRVMREEAEKDGKDIGRELYDMMVAMIDAGKQGNYRATKVVLEALCSPKKAAPSVAVQNNVYNGETKQAGPDLPPTAEERADYLQELQEQARKLGLLGNDHGDGSNGNL